MSEQPVATCQATEYEVPGRRKVGRHPARLLPRSGRPVEVGIKEYDRGDVWLDDHRFCLDDALRLARDAAPRVACNGQTALDAYHRTHPAADGGQP